MEAPSCGVHQFSYFSCEPAVMFTVGGRGRARSLLMLDAEELSTSRRGCRLLSSLRSTITCIVLLTLRVVILTPQHHLFHLPAVGQQVPIPAHHCSSRIQMVSPTDTLTRSPTHNRPFGVRTWCTEAPPYRRPVLFKLSKKKTRAERRFLMSWEWVCTVGDWVHNPGGRQCSYLLSWKWYS